MSEEREQVSSWSELERERERYEAIFAQALSCIQTFT